MRLKSLQEQQLCLKIVDKGFLSAVVEQQCLIGGIRVCVYEFCYEFFLEIPEFIEKFLGGHQRLHLFSFIVAKKLLKILWRLLNILGGTAENFAVEYFGFYSVYLVADYVEVISKHNNDKQYVGESTADGAFAISEDTWNEPLGCGTEIRLHLRDEASESLEQHELKELVQRYSEVINFPIYLWARKEVESAVSADDDDESNEEVIDEEYHKFYHSLAKDFGDEKPMAWSHFTAEGEFDELLPTYLSFLTGLVDSDTLPLNVSRVRLQQHSSLMMIKKQLTKKALDMIRHIADEVPNEFYTEEVLLKRGSYAKFWKEFGKSIKLVIIEDATNRSHLAKLLRFESTNKGKLAPGDPYISRMQPWQKDIFYITGTSMEHLGKSPFLERLTKKAYEVIFFTARVFECGKFGGNSAEVYCHCWHCLCLCPCREDIRSETVKQRTEK
ncbi:endoplasmin homolog [Aristolochia californica]|uniref:endoplasmin homolog n=1 Tax=Aristolochia californica TaxID=171875 RepID=UPI0035DC8E74